jgi:hypothetical protein
LVLKYKKWLKQCQNKVKVCFLVYFFNNIEKILKKIFLLIDTFSSHVFIHDYPNNSKIEAHYQSNGRLYYSFYNIISLGTYPSTPKLTQKSCNNMPQYPIPDNYIVETEISERRLRCESKYISNLKVCYTISWKEGHAEWSEFHQYFPFHLFHLFSLG